MQAPRTEETAPSPRHRVVWLVFFAPSAARAVLPSARRYFSFHPSTSPSPQVSLGPADDRTASPSESLPVHVAAIGPTTAEYLRAADPSSAHIGIRVDVVPEKPSAEELARMITVFHYETESEDDNSGAK